MTKCHIFWGQIYIAASPEQVWAAITQSEWTRRYFHATGRQLPRVRDDDSITETVAS